MFIEIKKVLLMNMMNTWIESAIPFQLLRQCKSARSRAFLAWVKNGKAKNIGHLDADLWLFTSISVMIFLRLSREPEPTKKYTVPQHWSKQSMHAYPRLCLARPMPSSGRQLQTTWRWLFLSDLWPPHVMMSASFHHPSIHQGGPLHLPLMRPNF